MHLTLNRQAFKLGMPWRLHTDKVTMLKYTIDGRNFFVSVIDPGDQDSGKANALVDDVRVELEFVLLSKNEKVVVEIIDSSEPLKSSTSETLSLMIKEVIDRGDVLPF